MRESERVREYERERECVCVTERNCACVWERQRLRDSEGKVRVLHTAINQGRASACKW